MTKMEKTLNDQITDVIGDKLDDIQLPVPTLVNAPADLDSAVSRIQELETALDDLSRAMEIALITKQFDLVNGFRDSAEEILQTKIIVEHPNLGPMKIAIVESEKNAQGTGT